MSRKRMLWYIVIIEFLLAFEFQRTSLAQPSNNILAHYEDGIVDIAASYNIDDGYRVVLVATRSGDVHEIFYKATPFAMPSSKGESVIAHFDGIVGIAGFYNEDDQFRIVIVATDDGNIWEVYYHPQKGKGQGVIAHFDSIVDIAGFYAQDDNYRIVLVATKDGNVHEIFYHPQKEKGQSIIAHYEGIVNIAATFGSSTNENDRNVIIVTSNGNVHQLRYHPMRGKSENIIDQNNDVTSVATNNKNLFTVSRDGRLREIDYLSNNRKELASIKDIKHIAVDYWNSGNLIYSNTNDSIHKFLFPIPGETRIPDTNDEKLKYWLATAVPTAVQGIVVSIDRVDPEIIWRHQNVTLSYTVKNFGFAPVSGQLEATLSGPPFASRKSLPLELPAHGSYTDRIVLPAHSDSGTATLQLAFDSHSDCIRIPWNNGAIREICRNIIHAEDSRQIAVIDHVDILTSPDIPGQLPPPLAKVCGSGLYPMNTVVPNPDAPYEWAEAPGGPAAPVLGHVINTNRNKTKDDVPWDHPFGFDFWFNLAPDPPYLSLLNVPSLAAVAGCPTFAPEVLCPMPGQPLPATCEPTDKTPRSDYDADACEAFCIACKKGKPAVGSLHTEIEERLMPEPYQPDDDDRVYMRGHHIVDCGHENYTAELHPPTLLVKAHTNPNTGAVQSTLIAAPYFTTQRYHDTTNLVQPSPKTFWDQVKALIAVNSFNPLPIPVPLKVLAEVDNVPFHQKIVAQYRVSLPPSEGKAAATLRYHFEVRPGISVQVTQPNQTQADVVVVLDPATYLPIPAVCNEITLGLEEIDSRWTHWPPGSLRVLLNGVLHIIPGAPWTPALQLALNNQRAGKRLKKHLGMLANL